MKCQAYLDPFNACWVDLCPIDKNKDEDELTKLKGFHLNQLIMPHNVPKAMERYGEEAVQTARHRWRRILTKYKESPPVVFRNEVLGVSDAIGTRMISKDELEALCNESRPFDQFPTPAAWEGIVKCVGGVDWSGGGTSGVSRTVLGIWG